MAEAHGEQYRPFLPSKPLALTGAVQPRGEPQKRTTVWTSRRNNCCVEVRRRLRPVEISAVFDWTPQPGVEAAVGEDARSTQSNSVVTRASTCARSGYGNAFRTWGVADEVVQWVDPRL